VAVDEGSEPEMADEDEVFVTVSDAHSISEPLSVLLVRPCPTARLRTPAPKIPNK
jgi:hypothetical protein